MAFVSSILNFGISISSIPVLVISTLRLKIVIEQIYEGEYQLPEFQRDYIWKDPNVKGLFESVLLGHPIGSILLLELNKENPLLAWVNFSEIIPPEPRQFEFKGKDKVPPRYLVLDGQQRLTSLSRLTNGTSEKTWFLNLKTIKESWEKNNSPESEKELKEWIELGLDITSALSKQNKSTDPCNPHFFRNDYRRHIIIKIIIKYSINWSR